MDTCKRCNETKPHELFYKHARFNRRRCNDCNNKEATRAVGVGSVVVLYNFKTEPAEAFTIHIYRHGKKEYGVYVFHRTYTRCNQTTRIKCATATQAMNAVGCIMTTEDGFDYLGLSVCIMQTNKLTTLHYHNDDNNNKAAIDHARRLVSLI